MNYALKILQDEHERIKNALNKWEIDQYPDARKERMNRLIDLTNAIELITQNQKK